MPIAQFNGFRKWFSQIFMILIIKVGINIKQYALIVKKRSNLQKKSIDNARTLSTIRDLA